MTDKRRNTPRNSDATHRLFRSQKTSQRQSRSSKTASQLHQNAYPQRRSTNPEPVERTLRSSERINRIREQGAKRTQVQPPRQPVNQAKKKQSQPASMRPVPKPERSQNASTRRVRAVSSHSETAFQQTSNGIRAKRCPVSQSCKYSSSSKKIKPSKAFSFDFGSISSCQGNLFSKRG